MSNQTNKIGNLSAYLPTAPKNRVTALYCRTSTLDQKNGLESQIRTLKEYCEKNKITNYELFTDDGISGTKSSGVHPKTGGFLTQVS